MKAYVTGMEIANRMKEQMLGRMKSELKDAPDSIIDAIAYRGFVDGLTSNTAVYDTKRASEMFKLKFEAAKATIQVFGTLFLIEMTNQDDCTIIHGSPGC